MKIKTWPDPPIHSSVIPPEIPSELRIFGVQYKVDNGNLVMNIPSKPISISNILEKVNLSLTTFIKLMRTCDESLIDVLKNIHMEINDEINLGKQYEIGNIITESKNNKIKYKRELIEKIMNIIDIEK